MPAYWVARGQIFDLEKYSKYTGPAHKVVRSFGGKRLALGGRFRILEGSNQHDRFVVVEFPSMEQAVACYESKEYQDLAAHRRNGGGTGDLWVVEGLTDAEREIDDINTRPAV